MTEPREAMALRALRAILALALVTVSIAAAYRLCWVRYRCEVVKKSAEMRVKRAFQAGTGGGDVGRAALADLHPCLELDPYDYQTLFLMGAAAELADQPEQALGFYRKALSYNDRPEIYAAMAVVQFGKGDAEEGMKNMERACLFNINFSRRVAQPMQFELQQRAMERQKRLQSVAAQRAGE